MLTTWKASFGRANLRLAGTKKRSRIRKEKFKKRTEDWKEEKREATKRKFSIDTDEDVKESEDSEEEYKAPDSKKRKKRVGIISKLQISVNNNDDPLAPLSKRSTVKKCNKVSAEKSTSEFVVLHQNGKQLNDITDMLNSINA